MKECKIPRIELSTVYLYQHYSLFIHNKLQYTWRGDYLECVQPAQFPVLTWSSSCVSPGITSTIRSPPEPRRIQRDAVFYPLDVGTNLPWYKEDIYCRRVDLLVHLLIWLTFDGNVFFCSQFHNGIAVFQVDSKWQDQYRLEEFLDIPCFLVHLIEYKIFMTWVYCAWSCKTVWNLKTYVETDE